MSGAVAKFNQSNSNSYFLNKTALEKISSGANGHQVWMRLSIWIELKLVFPIRRLSAKSKQRSLEKVFSATTTV